MSTYRCFVCFSICDLNLEVIEKFQANNCRLPHWKKTVPFAHGNFRKFGRMISVPGHGQRDSGSGWLCKRNRLIPEPIRFVRLDSEHAQSDGKSVNRGLPVLDLARGNAASGDENDHIVELV